MKALVLAGGSGTRLRPLSHTMSKQLVPIAGRPVLFYGLEALKDAGITDIGIVVGPKGDDVRQAVGTGAMFGVDVTYITQHAPLGLAHCVQVARGFLGDDDFLMYLGDNVIDGGVTALVKSFNTTRPDALVMVGKVADPRQFGVARLDPDGRVLQVEEKSSTPCSDLALIGAYVFSPAIHQAVRDTEPNWRNEREITDAIGRLVADGQDVRGEVFSGYWRDTGRVEDLLDCNREMLRAIRPAVHGQVDSASELIGAVHVEAGARITRSRLVGPAFVGVGTVISDSHIGPYTSIGGDCEVTDAGLEDSIMLDESGVRGVRGISGSLIGRQANVHRESTAAHRLVLGDHSRVAVAS
ncbi:glucose-1-phosphate thymidylyltransferase [Actinoallomurus vinaceus]|uniref:glucose-1-phosphate thymidylyltransferase n=1 Tax=Actinoallomurus vinaceus TaxID=1080074 RepID=UPI0031ECB82A